MTLDTKLGEETMKTSIKALYVTAFLGMPSLVVAGQTYDTSTIATGTQRTEVHAISDGHIVLHTISDYEKFEAADDTNPVHAVSGLCFGAIEIIGSLASGGGNCVFKDAGGDQISSAWKIDGFGAEGALVGTYVYTGGSGKFDGLRGGGSFSSVTEQATGKFLNTITGAARMP
jgi:hypothetical protein